MNNAKLMPEVCSKNGEKSPVLGAFCKICTMLTPKGKRQIDAEDCF
jgi:hypothetical protein